MENFLLILEAEIKRQEELLRKGKLALEKGPEGLLRCRERKDGKAFYLYGSSEVSCTEKNITKDASLLRKLVNKRIGKEIRERAEENIQFLQKLKKHYRPNEPEYILSTLPGAYREASKHIGFRCAKRHGVMQTRQYNFNPNVHIHETLSGIKVRSKSEMIIANALTTYGIPFLYEKPFPYPAANGKYYEPDFTFELPFGDMKIWENLGLLNDLSYCEHNAQKLNLYQKHGFVIGKNLLITQDDTKGGCDSIFIDKIIRQHLLPYYR